MYEFEVFFEESEAEDFYLDPTERPIKNEKTPTLDDFSPIEVTDFIRWYDAQLSILKNKKIKFSQKAFSQKINISKNVLANYLNGANKDMTGFKLCLNLLAAFYQLNGGKDSFYSVFTPKG
ncbi:MAG: hypothetical protein LBM01_04055 [Christensenellaceae bacterium]|jgi:transcriptional antiterminator|nr:hypothetical protein [Christensenellaceae bacterium]